METFKDNAYKMQLSLDTCIIILLCYLLRGLNAVRMIKVSIPAYKLRGESAFLECQYELSRHKNPNLHNTGNDGAERNHFDVNYSDADEMPTTYTRTRTYPYQNRQQQHQRQKSKQYKRFANGDSNPHYQYQQHTHQYQQYSQQQQPYQQQHQYDQQHQQQQYERNYQTQPSPYGHSIYRGRSPTSSVNFGARPGIHKHPSEVTGNDSRERGESFTDSAEDSNQRFNENIENEDEGEALYAIKWYKDNEEFYRYVPKANPPKTSYRVDGVRVIEEHSDSSRVLLRGLTLNSTGLYRCEISAEAPNFSSVQGEGRMDIVFLPRDGPHIRGQRFQYQIGEMLNLNCTSGKSHPASHLQWFINEQPVIDKRYLIHYNDTVHKHGLITSTLGLQLVVDTRHFQNGAMRVKCLASISPVLWKGGKESVLQRRPGIIDNREAMLLVRSSSSSLYQRNFQRDILLLKMVIILIYICQFKSIKGLI